MKIFGIGLSRTGTTTLNRALEILGYRSVHYPQNLAQISRFDAATDTPVALWYKTLDQMHPGSRFILTVRSLDSWLDSCAGHWSRTMVNSPFMAEVRMGVYGQLDFGREPFQRAYEMHEAEVRGYFRGREHDLLTLNICGGEGWEKLCPFLRRPSPQVPFPRLNVRKI